MERLGNLTALMLLIEIAVIDLQPGADTTSHFNVRTPLGGSLFAVMGISIGMLWLASVGIASALFRQKFEDRSFGWALRLGMVIAVLGSASGGLMTRPMPGQTSGIVGSHSVGAPDGGAGIVITNWSADHGDLRIGHFAGLHGMQVIPILYWFLSRKRNPPVALLSAIAASYFGAAVLLEWQALRGQSILQPDSLTIYTWITWLALSVTACLLTWVPKHRIALYSAAKVA